MAVFFGLMFLMMSFLVVIGGVVCAVVFGARAVAKHPEAARTGASVVMRLLRK